MDPSQPTEHVESRRLEPGEPVPPSVVEAPGLSPPPIAAVPPPPPPPVAPSEPEPLALAASDAGLPWRRRLAGLSLPWTVSMVLHLLVLLGLAIWILPGLLSTSLATLVLRTDATDELGHQDFEVSLVSSAAVLDARSAAEQFETIPELDLPIENSAAPVAALNVPAPSPTGDLPPSNLLTRPVSGAGGGTPVSDKQLRQAGSIEEAVGGIADEIRARLAEDDLLTVWMFDASISLLDDRQRVAERLKILFAELEARGPAQSTLAMNAAVAFGARVAQLEPPTKFGGRIVTAVQQVPIDNTGAENVMSAIGWAVSRYSKRPGQLMIVVWTDESGDDIAALESTIELCRERGVAVSIVGPSAVLGRQQGTHLYFHRPSSTTHLLPVRKGPDTALPERLAVPYWHWPQMPDWAATGGAAGFDPLFGGMPPWYGGPQLETFSSGFGPYALTRLAVQSGGSYTIFDRASDRGPFELAVMQPYQPDYRDARVILDELRYQPLRRAVLAAAEVTMQKPITGQPLMSFFPVYLSPPAFRKQLKAQLTVEAAALDRNAPLLEKVLAAFGPNGMEDDYRRENSPRWRAWYDLTRGRLLAMSVRQQEYLAVANLLIQRGALADATNYVDLVTVDAIRSGSEAEVRAREARRLLERCVEQNPETPWAYLAQRELDHPLGLDVRQRSIPRPPPRPAAPAAPRGNGPAITLPRL
jgi:hypothetical protein